MSTAPVFLGRGWSFPPQFTLGGGDVHTVDGIADVHQSLEIILSTGLQERVMQEDFGCELSEYLFEEIDQDLIRNIRNTVTDALIRHEPRIRVESVEVSTEQAQMGLLAISISYLIPSVNSRFNMVYPFYINEAYR